MMTEKTISEFLSNEYKEFAMYSIEGRAIPSVIDGFKPTQRKMNSRARFAITPKETKKTKPKKITKKEKDEIDDIFDIKKPKKN